MPGGSPAFCTPHDIDRMYEYLEILFDELSAWCSGTTLAELDGMLRRAAGTLSENTPVHNPHQAPIPA